MGGIHAVDGGSAGSVESPHSTLEGQGHMLQRGAFNAMLSFRILQLLPQEHVVTAVPLAVEQGTFEAAKFPFRGPDFVLQSFAFGFIRHAQCPFLMQQRVGFVLLLPRRSQLVSEIVIIGELGA